MRIQVNLASRPFVELRPFFLRLRLLMGLLALLGVGFAIVAHLLSARAATQQAQLDLLRNQTIVAQQAKLHTEQRMRDPVNARVLDRAHFLNALFLRKSFSWTAVMMDLENVLPGGVQVTSIEPAISPDGSVVIRLRVSGERANAVQLVRNLEHSRRFLQPRLAGEASQVKENVNGARNSPGPAPQAPTGPPGVEFDILANYNPLPPGQPYAAARVRSPAARVPATVRPPRAARNGYPAEGIRLAPYTGSSPSPAVPTPVIRPQGAPR